jgi:hypothetical protein
MFALEGFAGEAIGTTQAHEATVAIASAVVTASRPTMACQLSAPDFPEGIGTRMKRTV